MIDIQLHSNIKNLNFEYEPDNSYGIVVENNVDSVNPDIFEQIIRFDNPPLCIKQRIDFERLVWQKELLESCFDSIYEQEWRF